MIKIRIPAWNDNKQKAYDELDALVDKGCVAYHKSIEEGGMRHDNFHCFTFYNEDEETFYKLKYANLDWFDPDATFAYKARSIMDAGSFYCPYVPLMVVEKEFVPFSAPDPEPPQPMITFKTRYDKHGTES